jgi:hypothetical protein
MNVLLILTTFIKTYHNRQAKNGNVVYLRHTKASFVYPTKLLHRWATMCI